MTSAAWYEYEYSPRRSLPDVARYIVKWSATSAAAYATLKLERNLAYGDGLNETLDLFPAPGSRTLHVFIHGGFWRAFDKRDFAWVAPYGILALSCLHNFE